MACVLCPQYELTNHKSDNPIYNKAYSDGRHKGNIQSLFAKELSVCQKVYVENGQRPKHGMEGKSSPNVKPNQRRYSSRHSAAGTWNTEKKLIYTGYFKKPV